MPEAGDVLLRVVGLARSPFFAHKDLVLRRGEIVVLFGKSGSGKTLFLRALADLDPADAGEVWLGDLERGRATPTEWRRRVLYVHQGGVRLAGTAGENVRRVLALRAQRGRAYAPVPDVLDDAEADRLSGGERQAVALHRALLCEPDVLLLDECTSALDPERARAWEARVRAYADAGHAVLWVAHEEGLAARVGARREAFP